MKRLIALALAACAPAALPERTGVIFRDGQSRTLVGPDVKEGDRAPAFELVDPKQQPVRAAELAGKIAVVSVVPSIDTPVCEAQTGHMAAQQAKLPPDTVVLTISRDLPFAQGRFLADNRIDTRMASDFRDASFGRAWGVYVKETGLLARSVWVLDRQGRVAYRELVREQGTEPNYDALWQAVARVASH